MHCAPYEHPIIRFEQAEQRRPRLRTKRIKKSGRFMIGTHAQENWLENSTSSVRSRSGCLLNGKVLFWELRLLESNSKSQFAQLRSACYYGFDQNLTSMKKKVWNEAVIFCCSWSSWLMERTKKLLVFSSRARGSSETDNNRHESMHRPRKRGRGGIRRKNKSEKKVLSHSRATKMESGKKWSGVW